MELHRTRHTELNADQNILVKQLNLELPLQPPPRIAAKAQRHRTTVPQM